MRTALVYSESQLGFDPAVQEFLEALFSNYHFKSVSEVIKADDGKGIIEACDVIILIDSLEWYLANKLKIKGRPWVCMLSFCFEPNITLMTNPINETGIAVVISSCAHFVNQVSHVLPAMFAWRPVPSNASPSKFEPEIIGCVLPNTFDRDFCLLDMAAKIKDSLCSETKFEIFAREDDKYKLPASLEIYRHTYPPGEEAKAYQSIKFYIPAPRITDYRVGIVPPEIIRACTYGCQPLLIYHPALAPLQACVNPMFTSIKDYKARLNEVFTWKPGEKLNIVSTSIPKEMKPTAESLVNTVALAHQRWKANAS